MGKTTKLRESNSRRSSVSTIPSRTNLQSSISTHKKMLSAKKLRNKQRKSIQNMIAKLVDKGTIEGRADADNSIILVEDKDEDSPLSRKRKNPFNEKFVNKIQTTPNKSCIVLHDDDDDDNDLIINDSPCTKTSGAKGTCEKTKSSLFYSTPISNVKKAKFNTSNMSSINNISNNAKNNTDNKIKEINSNSFFTIDLTTETQDSKLNNTIDNTVIYVENHDTECSFVSANSSSSMNQDSDVSLLSNRTKRGQNNKMNKFVEGIAKMSANEKGRLLELITKKVFNGCKSPTVASNTSINKGGVARVKETAQDAYIKDVILSPTMSRNSIGSNIYNPSKDKRNKRGLRMVIIDGSNVAMTHGSGQVFSVKGLKICIDYFLKRGHVVKAFVPRFRCKYGKSTDPRLLDDLERRGLVVYTPSRELSGKMIVSYDDRYIVQCAAEFDGVIVSGDNYRDLMGENPRWRFVIENRLLPFTWVHDMIMFPKDPMGRNGPTLDVFLKHPQ